MMERRRALMGAQGGGELPILNPAVGYTENSYLVNSVSPPYLVAKTGAAATDFIDAGTSGNFVYFNPSTPSLWASTTVPTCGKVLQYSQNNNEATHTDHWNCVMAGAEKSVALGANKRYIRLNLPMENFSGVYAYNSSTGQIYYAGRDTQYYGKTNIND